MKALTAFGAPLQNLRASDLTQAGVVFQIAARHLIVNKRAVGRTQDLADLEWLEKNRKK